MAPSRPSGFQAAAAWARPAWSEAVWGSAAVAPCAPARSPSAQVCDSWVEVVSPPWRRDGRPPGRGAARLQPRAAFSTVLSDDSPPNFLARPTGLGEGLNVT